MYNYCLVHATGMTGSSAVMTVRDYSADVYIFFSVGFYFNLQIMGKIVIKLHTKINFCKNFFIVHVHAIQSIFVIYR